MWARFTLGNAQAVRTRFRVVADQLELIPRYNIAPSQFVPVVVQTDAERAIQIQRFGLIPTWSKEGPPKYSTINARAEDIEQKATYRRPFQRQRCLVPADGFYEWQQAGKSKIPMHIRLRDRGLFAFAGVYDRWTHPESGETIGSFALITTRPNELIEPIHNRMPVMLPPEAEDIWLDPDCHDTVQLKSLLQPYPADALEAYPVSPAVNRPANDSPALIEPWPAGGSARSGERPSVGKTEVPE